MRIEGGSVLFLLLIGVVFARAQQTSPAAAASTSPDQQGLTLVQSSLAALTGSAAGVPATIVVSGTVTPVWDSSASSYAVNIYVSGGDKIRWEEGSPGGSTAIVINGTNAQSQLASTATTLMPWEFAGKKLENFPILLLSRWVSSGNVQAQFVGLETIAGQSLNHVSVVDFSQLMLPPNPWHNDAGRGHYELYLDPATSLPIRLHYFQDTSDRALFSLLPVDLVYSNYQLNAGSVVPFTVTRYIEGTEVWVLQLRSVQPNAAVASQLFQIQ